MKGKFAVCESPATGEEGGQTHVQRLTPATDNQWPRAFKGEFQGCTGMGGYGERELYEEQHN